MEKYSSSSCSLEVTIISAEDLRVNDRPINKNAFVTVETDSNNPHSTSMDAQHGSYPSWNEKLELPFPFNTKHIRLDVKCKIRGSSVRTIGSVMIPITDFLDDYIPPNHLHFLSYRLRQQDGERNGIVNLSIRVKGAARIHSGYKNSNACGWSQTSYQNPGGVAVGIPVSKGYNC